MTLTFRFVCLGLAAVLALPAFAAPAVKTASVSPDAAILARTQPLRNLASVEGVRENPLATASSSA
jgi:flagellar P-ring protein precursor FlgI